MKSSRFHQFVFSLWVILELHGRCQALNCAKGQFLSRRGEIESCRPCESGTFMNEDSHVYNNCRPCKEAEFFAYQVLEEPCTPTSDARIGCLPGYYRLGLEGHGLDCRRCTNCRAQQQFEAQSCSATEDAKCCPEDGMTIAWDNQGVPVCVPKPTPVPIECPKGQYLRHDEGFETCVPCPKETFMEMERHRNINCRPCTVPRAYFFQIEQSACTSTTDTVIHCSPGYFRSSPSGVIGHTTECQRCRECQFEPVKKYEGRKCDSFSDTVCCSHPNMTVATGKDGSFKCLTNSDTDALMCGPDHYLSISKANHRECRPCPEQTFVSEREHNLTQCVPGERATDLQAEKGAVSPRPQKSSKEQLLAAKSGHKRKRKCEGSSLKRKKCRERRERKLQKRLRLKCIKKKERRRRKTLMKRRNKIKAEKRRQRRKKRKRTSEHKGSQNNKAEVE